MLGAITGTLGALATLPGTLELSALTLGALLPARTPTRRPEACGKLAVIVPAHNEAKNIGRALHSLMSCERPKNGVRFVVVADNCSDDTADRARDAGAAVREEQQ